VEELALLAPTADAEKIEGLAQAIDNNLEEARSLAATLTGTEQMKELLANLEGSASRQLSILEASMVGAPEEIKSTMSDVYKTASESYGQAVESVAVKTPITLVGGQGFLQVLASDPPPPALENVFIEVSKIEAHLAAEPDSGWITVVDSSNIFDLLVVDEIQKFLGEQLIAAGTYTQIRFDIDKAVVVAQGEAHVADVPSGKIRFHRPFVVEEGETTVITIDFNGQRSVKVTGEGTFKLDPDVKLLVDEPEAEPAGSEPQVEPKEKKVEIEGLIESISDTQWIVDGQPIAVTPETKVEGTPDVGLIAEVVVVVAVEADGSFTAVEIEIKAKKEEGLGKTKFEGPIEAIGDTAWQVAGRTINVTSDSEIEVKGEGDPEVGRIAKVKALVQYDGTFTALKIEVKEQKADGSEEMELEGTIEDMNGDAWQVGGYVVNITPETQIDGDPEVGLPVKVEGLPQTDGSVMAVEIEVREEKKDRSGKIEVKAAIGVMGNGTWEIGGRIINITSETKIDGEPRVGRIAKVEGVVQTDGSIKALEIEVEEPEEDEEAEGDEEPQETPEPEETEEP